MAGYKFKSGSVAIGEQVLTAKLYTDGHRSGDGLDVAMWNPDTKKLDPIQDSDTVNMDSVGSGAETLHKRQVRIFFAKSKNGYLSPIGAYKAFANEGSTGGKVIAETGKVAQLSATTMGETGTLEIYDKIWQEAKNAVQAAGYTEYVGICRRKDTQYGLGNVCSEFYNGWNRLLCTLQIRTGR